MSAFCQPVVDQLGVCLFRPALGGFVKLVGKDTDGRALSFASMLRQWYSSAQFRASSWMVASGVPWG